MLLEGYLTAALRISDLAIGDAEAEPGTSTFSIPSARHATPPRGWTAARHTRWHPRRTYFSGGRRVRVLRTASADRRRRIRRRRGTRKETERLFGRIVRENRSALGLLDADYTFLNERLARHYGIRGVFGDPPGNFPEASPGTLPDPDRYPDDVPRIHRGFPEALPRIHRRIHRGSTEAPPRLHRRSHRGATEAPPKEPPTVFYNHLGSHAR